ncbi:fungal-specific transcription factor domain-containing protein [Stachybotrys elegans]|uniref:Fungal-specific transcription factor domain-containing protein n=1 Tax=Stachybotrys elegans TaxID=80388 RepID=A0A8K0WMP1_9HYPO|nr:fungal-specific transcription factor domain-containing protein [Stachybotrys elegans]
MAGVLRSKHGCWTCRLRKKKCDEERPCCKACKSLTITCHGYGPRPSWMSNADEREAIQDEIRSVVKDTAKRKRTQQPASSTPMRPILPASDLLDSSPSVHHNHASEHGHSHGLPEHDSNQAHSSELLARSDSDDELMKPNLFANNAQESMLIMYFFDQVFPLQYPMYDQNRSRGGRGWLLSLILRTKPLYHAALALSAHHRQAAETDGMCLSDKRAALNQQEYHFDMCMRILRRYAQTACPGNRIGYAVTVVQQLFFELWTSHENSWKAHLDMLLTMCEQKPEFFADIGAEPSVGTGFEEMEKTLAHRHFDVTMIWLDVISCVSTGALPRLLPHYPPILDTESPVWIEEFVGCKSPVLVQVCRIAALHAQKKQAQDQGTFSAEEFEQAVLDIRLQIHRTACSIDTQAATPGILDISRTRPRPSDVVTSIFSHMAEVYLHLVARGFHNLELVQSHITEAINIIQSSATPNVLRSVVCPLYVIGLAADLGNQLFFQHVFSSQPLFDPALQHRQKLLPILEEVWRRRGALGQDVMWESILDLTSNILLV